MNHQNKTIGGGLLISDSFKFLRKSFFVFITVALVASGFFAPQQALAAANVTVATGGTNVSIDTTFPGGTGAYTALSGPGINELVAGDISVGVHTITLPAGWEFEDSTITITPFGNDIVFASNTVSPNPGLTSFSFEVTAPSSTGGFVGFSGLKVRPTGITPSTGNMTHSGAVIAGVVDGSTNFGTLTTVPGTVTKLTFETQPTDTVYGSTISTVVVKIQDQFGNDSTNGASGKTVLLTLAPVTGTLSGTDSLDISSGVATFSDLKVDTADTGYTLTASADGLASAVSDNFEIIKKSINVTAQTDTKVYDGTTDSLVAPIVDEPEDGDTIDTAPTQAFDTKDFGTGKTLIPSGLVVNDGNGGNNYLPVYVNNTTGEIEAKELTVTGATTIPKIYNGELDATINFSLAELVGVVPGEDVSVSPPDFSSSIALFDNENVGTGKEVTISGIGLGGADAGNYSLTQPVLDDGVITEKDLTVTAVGVNREYNQTTIATVALSSVDEESGDGLVYDYTGALFLNKTAENGKTVNVSGISISGGNSGNYTLLNETAQTTANITKKEITATLNVNNKTYNGNTNAVFSGTLSHIVLNALDGDDVTVANEGTKAFESKHVGDNKTVNATGIVLEGDDSANYEFNGTGVGIANITQRPITVTAVTDTKPYDGTEDSVGIPTIDDLQTGDTASFTQTYDNKNVDTNKVLTPDGLVNDGNPTEEGSNYLVTFEPVSTGEITKAPLTATVTVQKKVVDGDDSATIIDVILNEVIGSDVVTVSNDGTATFEDALVGNNKDVTATGVEITGADSGNYDFNGTATGTGEILPVPTTVYVNNTWDGTNMWADPDNEGPATYFGYDAFDSVQDAIDAVEEDGTVNVASGTYVESVTIDKSLTIQKEIGAPTKPIIQANDNWGFKLLDAVDITIDGFEIQIIGGGSTNDQAIRLENADGAVIKNNTITTTADTALGIWTCGTESGCESSDDVSINDNNITIGGVATGIYTEQVDGAHTGWSITGNTIIANTGVPLELYDVSDSIVDDNTLDGSTTNSNTIWSSQRADISDLVFTNNIISDSSGSMVAFLSDFLLLGDGLDNTTISGVNINGNTFQSWGARGLRIGDGVTSVTANQNKFLGTGEALKNEDASGVDATNNWWGTAVLSTIDGKISGSVDYDPYYVNSGMTLLSNVAVNTAYVDSTYSDGAGNDGHYFGYDAFATIQEAIDAVASSGTVNVDGGIYTENITIDKSLTLSGDRGDTNVAGPGVGAPFLDGSSFSGVSAIRITAGVSNVIIEGFEIGNYGPIGNTEADAINAWNSQTSAITVQDNYFHDLGWNGILVGSDDDTVQSGWIIQNNIIANAAYAGIELTNVINSQVLDNEITGPASIADDPGDAGVGIEIATRAHFGTLVAGTGITVSGNEITGAFAAGSRTAINLLSRAYNSGSSAATLSGVTVSGNIITGSGTRGVNIVAESRGGHSSTVSGLTITGNTLSGNTTGIEIGLADGSPHANDTYDAGTIDIDTNSIDGNTFGLDNTTGIELNASANWWGSADGPTHSSNPGVNGDAVSDNVDFRPWYLDNTLTNLDETSPTPVIASVTTSPTNASIIPVTVDFVESVFGFEESDLTVENGAISNFAGSGATYTFDITPTGDGVITVDVAAQTAWNASGNYNNVAVQFEITVDSVAPTTSVTAPSSGGSYNGDIEITADASDDSGIEKVEFWHSSTDTLIDTDTSAPFAAIWDSTDTAEGSHTIYVKAYDNAGNVSTSESVTVTLDRTAPVVAITAPTASAQVNGATVITFTTDEEGGSPECSVDNTNWTTCVSGTTILNDIAGFAGLVEGAFTLYFRDTDEAGNVGEDEVSLAKDSVVPSVESHTPSINAVNVETNEIIIEFSENVIVGNNDITLTYPTNQSTGFSVSGPGTDTITLNTNQLESNTVYTVTVTTGVTDEAGNAVAEYNWSFTTATLYNVALNADNGGWNLISLPIVPTNTSISTVLGSALSAIDVVWMYDPTNVNADDENYGWFVYYPDNATLSSLETMTAGYGYWVSVTGDTNISGSGSLLTAGPTSPPSRTLTSGWNLVGYYQIPGEDSSNMNDAFSSIGSAGTDYTALFGFNNSSGAFTNNVTTINPGDAFWVSVSPNGGKNYTPSNL